MNLSELDLVNNCKKNNATAQKQLYDGYISHIIKVCLRYINNKADIEDIIQHTFEKAFLGIKNFEYKGNGSLKAWLHRIAINECLMQLRKNKSFPVLYTDEDKWIEDKIDHSEETNNDTENHDINHVLNCIKKLPEGYRTVLNLYVFDDLKHEAIAQELNISISTSKSQLSRARQLLKKLLNS